MPQVLTRRSEPITLLAKRGHLHLQTQKLALVVITQEAEAHLLNHQSQHKDSLKRHTPQTSRELSGPSPCHFVIRRARSVLSSFA